MFKKILSIIFFLFFFSFNNVYSQEKLVFIDINYIFSNSEAGKKINKEILNENKKINSEFSKFQKKIDSEKKTLLTQKNVISDEEYEKKLRELEKNFKEYNSIINTKNRDLNNFKKKVRLEFSNNLNKILEDYSKKNSISMILKKENILIGKTNLDATNDVLVLFNKNNKIGELFETTAVCTWTITSSEQSVLFNENTLQAPPSILSSASILKKCILSSFDDEATQWCDFKAYDTGHGMTFWGRLRDALFKEYAARSFSDATVNTTTSNVRRIISKVCPELHT